MEEWSFRLGINIEHNSSLNIDEVFEKTYDCLELVKSDFVIPRQVEFRK